MKRSKNRKRILSLALALILTFSLPPVAVLASTGSVTVKIIGENSIILNTTVNVESITEYTTDSADSSAGINALDAVISATLQNGSSAASYDISYSAKYGAYSLNKIAAITPSGNDYWGSLAVSAAGSYDGNALSTHPVALGDTYIVYYNKNTGGSANYGYQSYAWFTEDTLSGTAGSVISVEAKTTGYDANYNTIASALSNATIYATGPSLAAPSPVAVTDGDGKAYIVLPHTGTYSLTLSSDYTYAKCEVNVDGSAILNGLSISVTDGTNNLANALLALTDSAGSKRSPYEINSGTYLYRLTDGSYSYQVKASGYAPASGTVTVSGTTSKSVVLNPMTGYTVTITPHNAIDEKVAVKNSSGVKQTAISTANGVYTYDLGSGSYTYAVNRSGYHSSFCSFTVSGKDMNISPAALTDQAASAAEWPAYRDFGDNMATVSAPIAHGSWQAEEKWSSSLGSLGLYCSLSTSNIVLYDGYLYVATEHGLAKVDKSTGTLLTTTALSTGTSYITQIAYGDGKVYVTTAVGIDAFDALTMELQWSAPISAWGDYMAATPLLVNNQTIYVGDYGDSKNTLGTYGGYCAINAVDGTSKWIMYGGATDARYWAGTVIAGDYVVFGSDSGCITSVKTDANGYASAADKLSVNGKIRSSIAYDGTALYFTTISGYLYKASIDASTGKFTTISSRQFSSSSNSTPVVCNGRIYVGASDGIYVLNADNLAQVSHYTTGGAVQSSALVSIAYGSTTYAYFTVNSAQGEIIALCDDGTSVSYDTLYIPSHIQYCLNSLIADSDGTIYYTNDSGYLCAIRNSNISKTDKTKMTISVTPASLYNSSTYTTTYPSITVSGSGGAAISTPVAGIYYLSAGSYTYAVSLTGYNVANGSFTVTENDIATGSKTIPVTLTKTSPDTTPTTLAVTVSVIGSGNNTWINKYSVTVAKDSSAWVAIKKALDSCGLNYVATETAVGIYISSVNGLNEFDKGSNSGWKYTVNGTAPSAGVSSYTLSDGDILVLYYTNDYQKDSDFTSVIAGSTTSSTTDLTAVLDKSTGVASVILSGGELIEFNKAITGGDDTNGFEAVITVSTPGKTTAVNLTMPQSAVAGLSNKSNTSLKVETSFCSLTFDPKAIDQINATAGTHSTTISIAQADISKLSDESKTRIGARPVYDLTVMAGSTPISDFGVGSVNVSIPYTLEPGEDKNAVVVYYIGDSGALQAIRGAYRAETGTVAFTLYHFSEYAVGYNKISFSDVASTAWCYDAVTFCAARGIATGTGNALFAPETTLSRGQFIVMLMRAYGIAPDKNPAENFSDAGDAYYTDYLSAAKRLEISAGVGDNKFAPEGEISRQDMFTLLYRALNILSKLPTATAGKTLADYTDAGEIADYAKTAMETFLASGVVSGSEDKLNPRGTSTRAQMAQVLYKLLSD